MASHQHAHPDQRLDVTGYIDYLLLNYYGGNRDWGENRNWSAIRRRQPAGPFRFYVWDGEQVLQGVREDIVNRPYEVPFRLGKGKNLRCRALENGVWSALVEYPPTSNP